METTGDSIPVWLKKHKRSKERKTKATNMRKHTQGGKFDDRENPE